MNTIEQFINSLYHPDSQTRDRAEAELSRMNNPAVLEPLLAVLRGQYPAPRPRRVTGMLGLGPSQRDLEAAARRHAATLLGAYADPRAVEALSAATKDPDERVRHAAGLALGGRGDPRAVEALLGALSNQDYVIRAEAAERLGVLGDPRAVEALIRTMQIDGQPVPRWKAIYALGQLRDRRAVAPMIAILKGLLALPPEDWAPPEHLEYGDDDHTQIVWATSTQILDALDKLGDPAALPMLDKLAHEAPARSIAAKAQRCADRLRQQTSTPSQPA